MGNDLITYTKDFSSKTQKARLLKAYNDYPGIKLSLSGKLDKSEGLIMGGYGHWNRDLVESAKRTKLNKMTHFQKMKELRKDAMLNKITNSKGAESLKKRLENYKLEKKNGYR